MKVVSKDRRTAHCASSNEIRLPVLKCLSN